MSDTPFTCGGCFDGYDDIDDARACCPDYATLVSSDADWPPKEDEPLRRRGPDWAERNPEAADMEAQRHRMLRQQGRTSGGRRL